MVNETKSVWIIKDSKGNFAHRNSIRVIEKGVMAYISYRTFSEECRWYSDLSSGTGGIMELRSKAMQIGLSEDFSLVCEDLDELIDFADEFSGIGGRVGNMVVVEVKVVVSA